MKVAVWINQYKDGSLEYAQELLRLLDEDGFKYILDERHRIGNAPYTNFDKLDKSIDAMLVLGGDGTILNVVRRCASQSIPILGINFGSVGFLSEVERDEIRLALTALKTGNYKIEPRSMLKINVGGYEFHALNEVFVGRQAAGKMAKLKVFAGCDLIDRFDCDGIVLSTPTGSTAYSLAAGGPLVAPNTKVFCITPVSPHSLHSRPIVINDNEQLIVRLAENRGRGQIIVDGSAIHCFDFKDEVKVVKSKKTANFIRIKNTSFYMRLIKKLNKWSLTEELE